MAQILFLSLLITGSIILVLLAHMVHKNKHTLFQKIAYPQASVSRGGICGSAETWQREYKAYHTLVMSGVIPPRILVYECIELPGLEVEYCGGMSDRIRGVVASMYIAAMTGRALVVNTDKRFILALSPNQIAWNLTNAKLDLFGDTPEWLTDMYTNIHSNADLPQILKQYITGPTDFPLTVMLAGAHKAPPIDMFVSDAPLVRFRTNPYLSGAWLPNVTSLLSEYYTSVNVTQQFDYIKEFKYDYINEFKNIQTYAAVGCAAKFIFMPAVSAVRRLHAAALDFAEQILDANLMSKKHERGLKSKKYESRVKYLYEKYQNIPQVIAAFSEFTKQFLQEWQYIPSEFIPALKGESAFKILLNKLLVVLKTDEPKYNGMEVTIRHVVGAHFRCGGNQPKFDDWYRINEHQIDNFVVFIHDKMLKKYREAEYTETYVVLLSDSQYARERVKAIGDKFLTPTFWGDKQTTHSAISGTEMQIIEVLSEMFILTQSDTLILTHSGLGAMGYLLMLRSPHDSNAVIFAAPIKKRARNNKIVQFHSPYPY